MDLLLFFISFFLLLVSELFYLKIADHYSIIDKPNYRSSHTQITIRGGGIVFPISVLLWFVLFGFQYHFFVCGLILVSIVSFIDDIKDISRRIRITAHIIAVSFIFYQLNVFIWGWLFMSLGYVLFIGIINAYNFMDGINGITGVYSVVLIGTLYWINRFYTHFVEPELLTSVMIGLLVFNYFNFRKKAVCFAGDVGSISMAIIVCFLLAKLVIQTSNLYYIIMLTVYGLDAIYTILLRLFKGENIFEAHRMHLYQIIVNQFKGSPLLVSALYGGAQLIINTLLLMIIYNKAYAYTAFIVIVPICFYLIVRFKFTHLINRNKKII